VNGRRRLAAFLALAAAASLVVGTDGFSAASIDRDVDVRVVDDSEAYLGIQNHGPVVREARTSTRCFSR